MKKRPRKPAVRKEGRFSTQFGKTGETTSHSNPFSISGARTQVDSTPTLVAQHFIMQLGLAYPQSRQGLPRAPQSPKIANSSH